MTDDPNCADYWRHKAANARYCAHGVVQPKARTLLEEIADRYAAISEVVEHEPITEIGRQDRRTSRKSVERDLATIVE